MRKNFEVFKEKKWISKALFAAAVSVAVLGMPMKSQAAAGSINVAYHTKEEVAQYLNNHTADVEDPVSYVTQPTLTPPYGMGTFTSATTASALDMVNQVRYIAGLQPVTIDGAYTEKAQAAAILNRAIDRLTHTPVQDGFTAQGLGMDQHLFDLGCQGAGATNLAFGYPTLNAAIIDGWMEDGDSGNIDRLGHRRWVLNPRMGKTGFGYADSYAAMYSMDYSNSNAPESQVAWPAQTMPLKFFNTRYPWSISIGSPVQKDSVSVTMKRHSDQREWSFSAGGGNGYFNVNNDGYGQSGVIIWKPDSIENYKDGDVFDITISGLNAPVSYSVEFMDTGKVSDTTPPAQRPLPFGDVKGDDWFYSYVNFVYQRGLMTGMNETTFGPAVTLSRAQMVTILYRIQGMPEATFKQQFPDVQNNGDFFVDAVMWAASNGVVKGYENGNFGPADDITREQLAVMMFNYANFCGYDTDARADLSAFPDDEKVSPFADEAIRWAVGTGLISGNKDSTLAPQGQASRAVCATIINRFYEAYGI